MPYVVLARRGRPQSFSEVVGQEHVTKTLQNAIFSDRIAHAYLFTGPRGVGKTTVARILAKAVNCTGNHQSEPCNECNNCIEISSGRSIDVIEIDAASNRGIDEIRELRENVKFAPVNSKYKVYIIDEAHMLTIEAFNALLKTLEEPPGHVIFILATTEPHKIPATILSRCQRFDFRMLTQKEIINRLKELLALDNKNESIHIEDEALSLIAESADGGMRDAESLLDQVLSFSNGNITAQRVSELLGIGSYQLLGKLIDNIIQGNSSQSLENLNQLAIHGADLSQCLKKLVSYFRDIMVYKINPNLIDASQTRMQELEKLSKGISIDRIMKIVKILTQTENDIKQLGYERLNFELALVKLSKLKDDSVPLDKVLDKLEEIENKLSTRDFKISNIVSESEMRYNDLLQRDTPQMEIKGSDAEKLSDPLQVEWNKFLELIKKKSVPIHAFLIEAVPVSIEDGTITIDFDPKYSLHREKVLEALEKELSDEELTKLMGKKTSLKVQPIKDEKKLDKPNSQRDIRLDAMQDDFLQTVLKIFDGRIVEVKK